MDSWGDSMYGCGGDHGDESVLHYIFCIIWIRFKLASHNYPSLHIRYCEHTLHVLSGFHTHTVLEENVVLSLFILENVLFFSGS